MICHCPHPPQNRLSLFLFWYLVRDAMEECLKKCAAERRSRAGTIKEDHAPHNSFDPYRTQIAYWVLLMFRTSSQLIKYCLAFSSLLILQESQELWTKPEI